MTPTLSVVLQIMRHLALSYLGDPVEQMMTLFERGDLTSLGFDPSEMEREEMLDLACAAALHARTEECVSIIHQHMHSDGGYMPPSKPQWRVGHKIKPSSS